MKRADKASCPLLVLSFRIRYSVSAFKSPVGKSQELTAKRCFPC